jgi:hypothetical protein
MLTHVVMWKLKDKAEGRDKKENALLMKELLENLNDKIPELLDIRVELNCLEKNDFDILLIAKVENETALDKYINHPEHEKVSNFVSKIREARVAIDYIE